LNGLSFVGYAAIFTGATLLSLLLVPLALRTAVHLDVFDHPGGYKQQRNPVPYLGGVAIIIAFAGSILAAAAIQPPVSGFAELAVILGSAVALGLVGLIDDLRSLPLWPRLTAMFAAGGALWMAGVRVHLFDGGVVDLAITLVWVVGITNAFNLLDNMDGLSAGTAVVASLSFFLIAAANGQFLVAALSLALAGAAIGFLRHNRYPAKIYMGDAGSLFLGFMLAVVGVKLRFHAPREITAFVPILVLGIAIFDTVLVVVTRMRAGKSPFAGGRDHTSHRLAARGIPVRRTVGLLHLAGGALGWLAMVMSRLRDPATAYLLIGFVVSVAVLSAGMLLRQKVIRGLYLGADPTSDSSHPKDSMPTQLKPWTKIPQ
jgi:UDP-GlcNAc:undecaprenyl-phosphate GlcNAc-1-phosphate transferase